MRCVWEGSSNEQSISTEELVVRVVFDTRGCLLRQGSHPDLTQMPPVVPTPEIVSRPMTVSDFGRGPLSIPVRRPREFLSPPRASSTSLKTGLALVGMGRDSR